MNQEKLKTKIKKLRKKKTTYLGETFMDVEDSSYNKAINDVLKLMKGRKKSK